MKELMLYYGEKNVKLVFGTGILQDTVFPEGRKYLILTDENVAKEHLEKIRKKIPAALFKILPAGEESKSLEMASDLFAFMLAEGFSKDDCLIAFGGGMITDLAGFVSSLYKRGMNFISIPTSLLAQVDSALGGKTGVNFSDGKFTYKNQIGTIFHPELIVVDPDFLKTLPHREFLSGLGEVIKYGLCFAPELFEKLASCFDYEDIFTCLEIKAKITERDEKETGERMLLNYGHTIGHALESLSGFALRHGEAVALGLLYETADLHIKEKIRNLLDKYAFPNFSFQKSDLLAYIKQDKKIRNGKLKLPVLKAIGKVTLEETDIDAFLRRIS